MRSATWWVVRHPKSGPLDPTFFGKTRHRAWAKWLASYNFNIPQSRWLREGYRAVRVTVALKEPTDA